MYRRYQNRALRRVRIRTQGSMQANLAAPPARRKRFDHVEPAANARQQTASAMIRSVRRSPCTVAKLGFSGNRAPDAPANIAPGSVMAGQRPLRFVFAEIPDRYTVAGAAVIVGSTLYIAYREAHLSRLNRAALAAGGAAAHPEDAARVRDPAPVGLTAPRLGRRL